MEGKRLGDYRIESELGRGGMGTVWLATGPEGNPCAIKIIHPRLEGARERVSAGRRWIRGSAPS